MLRFDEKTNLSPMIDLGVSYRPEDIVYFDIETTGFSPLNTQLYLIGLICYEEGAYHIRQFFADTKEAEANVLKEFLSFLSDKKCLVHFNGSGFDLPYIIKRCRLLHIPCDLGHVESVDLYKLIFPLKSVLKVENLKQKTLEAYLGLDREDQYNGGELIRVYQDYLETQDEKARDLLLLHNHDDVLGMMAILPLLHYTGLLNGEYHVISASVEEHTNIYGSIQKELLLELALDRFLPKRISCGNEHFYCVAAANTARLCIQVYEGELKYFYPNYKDYYYLPAEDRALHKSVASFVDKEFRIKARASNCYSKKNGIFLPEYEEIISPSFKEEYDSPISYFEFTEAMLKDFSALRDYVKHVLKVILR